MCISMKEIWCNLDGPLKNKELWSYVVKFEFSMLLFCACIAIIASLLVS